VATNGEQVADQLMRVMFIQNSTLNSSFAAEGAEADFWDKSAPRLSQTVRECVPGAI
jgi:hypothetical protein